MRYRREIDGLRAIAVIPVILYHAGFSVFSGGFVGVDVFFVISGYLISTIILSEMEAGKFSLTKFYERRARRILPALVVVTTACLPFAWYLLPPNEMEDFAQSIVATFAFSSNFLFWQETGYFDTSIELKPLIHTWSLAVEEQFYILFPLFLMLAWRFERRWIWAIIAAVFLGSLLLAHWSAENEPSAAFYLLPTRMWELLVGAFAFIYFKHENKQLPRVLVELLGVTGLILVLSASILFNKETPHPSLYTLLPTLGTLLIILFAREGTITCTILRQKIFVGIGLISYSAYLWHQPMLAFARHHFVGAEFSRSLVAGLLFATAVLSYLSYKFVETPFRDKKLVSKKQIFGFSISTAVLLIGVGIAGYLSGGNLNRYSEDELEVVGNQKERNAFVWERKNRINNASLDMKKAQRVLVVGDSFSGDLINVLGEAGLRRNVSLSSVVLTSPCMKTLADILVRRIDIAEPLHKMCNSSKFGSKEFQALFEEATIVLFAADWREVDIQTIHSSVRQLEERFGNKMFVIGTKEFSYDPTYASKLTASARRALFSSPLPSKVDINKQLKNLFQDRFVNIITYMCDGERCPVFTNDLRLVTYDKRHLTKNGAKDLGGRLCKDEPFSDFCGKRWYE